MTWIKTVSMQDDEDRSSKAMEAQRKVYPQEYATPVPAVDRGTEAGITSSHSLIPDALYHSFSAFGAMMSPELPAAAPAARNDCDDGLGHQPVPLLNRISRRVSA